MFLYLLGVLMTCANYTYSQMPHTFTTERIRAEKVTNDHCDYLAQIISDPKVQEAYYSNQDKAVYTNISAQLAIINDQWKQYGYGLYIIFDKKSSEFLGFAGFHVGTVNCPNNELEIYGLGMPDFWQKGYGFEVGTRLISLAFEHLPYKSIIACVEPKNLASLMLVKKLKFVEESRVIYDGRPHILYRIHKNIDTK